MALVAVLSTQPYPPNHLPFSALHVYVIISLTDLDDPKKRAACDQGGFGSGGLLSNQTAVVVSCALPIVNSSTNNNPHPVNLASSVNLSNVNSADKLTVESALIPPTHSPTTRRKLMLTPELETRRKLTLTPELERKSPNRQMIGRRELDISERFLKSFSDSSSEDEEDSGSEINPLPTAAEMQNYSVDMPVLERGHSRPRLSVIKEDSMEESPGSRTRSIKEPNSKSNGELSSKTNRDANKLRLVIQPDQSEADITSRLDGGTPVTPGKYSSNWDDFGAVDGDMGRTTSSSWSSTAAVTEVASANQKSDSEDDMEYSHFPADSIVSPKPVIRKNPRRSALKKKSKNIPSSKTDSVSNPFFSFSANSSPSPNSAFVPLVSGSFNLVSAGVCLPSPNTPPPKPADEAVHCPVEHQHTDSGILEGRMEILDNGCACAAPLCSSVLLLLHELVSSFHQWCLYSRLWFSGDLVGWSGCHISSELRSFV